MEAFEQGETGSISYSIALLGTILMNSNVGAGKQPRSANCLPVGWFVVSLVSPLKVSLKSFFSSE